MCVCVCHIYTHTHTHTHLAYILKYQWYLVYSKHICGHFTVPTSKASILVASP